MTKMIMKLKKSLSPTMSPNSAGKLVTTLLSMLISRPRANQRVLGLPPSAGSANSIVSYGLMLISVISFGFENSYQ